jgi:Fe-S oxidoreductase
MGWIARWARLAELTPNLVNLLTHTPGLARLAKAVAGIEPRRDLPRFASETFRHWWRRRPRRFAGVGRPRVVLWPDTFNDHFHPEVARAAVHVLESAGWEVVVPAQRLCCGRPLYDFGFLDEARRRLAEILGALGGELAAGTPIVALEPSCLAVFKDELPGLYPQGERARRLAAQACDLGTLIGPDPLLEPQPGRQALVHGHCHQKSVVGMQGAETLLRSVAIDYQLLDAGCCGMAGAFGFQPGEHYRVSQAAGERVLLPAVRRAAEDTVVIADGFSCRTQIEQATGRRPRHLAEAVAEGLEPAPELARVPRLRPLEVLLAAAAVIGLGAWLTRGRSARRRARGGGRARAPAARRR